MTCKLKTCQTLSSDNIVVFLTTYFALRAFLLENEFSEIIQVGRWSLCPVLPT